MSRRAKPIMHGRDHAPDGPDPITTGNAVLFDTYPQDGDTLTFDTSNGIEINNKDTGNDGGIFIRNQDDGGIVISDDGDGIGIDIQSAQGGLILIEQNGTGNLKLLVAGGHIILEGLPSTDPGVSNALWNSSGTLKISP